MRYYISDLHFGHGNLNDHMDCRGFEDVESMNEHMIQKWNSKVRSVDEVVILGDFCISKSSQEVNEILARLNGKKSLIIGNHDKYLEYKNFSLELFQWIAPYKELYDNKRKVILSHYPIMCYNGQYRRDKEGHPKTYMLYGHVHNSRDEYLIHEFQKQTRLTKREDYYTSEMINIPCQMINCFCMFSDYVPLTLEEWIAVDKKRREEM
ncbi:metallophosphoesterase [Lachnospiraceae bacterium OttesenSCG-928-D06]|nr:metallophosphoesterase [Lachnospiraceae bacterium OttesenSCG-928-D06]